jgi:hypothetical protein
VASNKNNTLQEEMLLTLILTTNTTGLSIFTAAKSYFAKHNILFSNIVACATDGAPSMIDRYRGFIAFFERRGAKYFVYSLCGT